MSAEDGHHVRGDYPAHDSEHMQAGPEGTVCLDPDPRQPGGVCTRDKGHDGQHEAGSGIPGFSICIEAVWP